jgi:hypothetical protein
MQWLLKRPLWRIALEFALVFALLLLPWPGLDHQFARAFCGIFNALGAEQTLDVGYLVHLQPAAPTDLPAAGSRVLWHALFCVRNPLSGLETRLGFNTRSSTYLPLAALIAFVVATRLWQRRGASSAAVLGVGLTLGYSSLSFLTSALRFLALPRVQGLQIDASILAALDAVFNAFFVPPGMAYAVPLFAGTLMLWLTKEPASSSAATLRDRA